MSRQNPPSKKTRSTLRRMRFRKKKRARPLGSKRANKAAQLIHYTGRSTAPISTRVAAPRKRVSVGVTCRLSMSRKNEGNCGRRSVPIHSTERENFADPTSPTEKPQSRRLLPVLCRPLRTPNETLQSVSSNKG